jgi:RNA polymerase sigma-70 factor (sigma-E family)
VRVSEREEFGAFVDRSSDGLLRAGWLLTGDWHTAHDLVQSALAATWTHWWNVTRTDAPELYVRRVMMTTFLRWRRRRWTGEAPTALLPEPVDEADHFDQADLRNTLLDALGVLSPNQRAVVVLRYFVDLSEAQIADALGCSTGTVKSHASKALAKLRDVPGLAQVMTGGAVS